MLLPQLRRIRWAVRATLLLGVAASVLANILHALDNPISQAIAAWPPIALLLTVELISRVPVHRRTLAATRLIATALIAGIAAWVSYWHMAGVAARYGETGASPYLLPLSVDGLIVVASICLVELGGRIASLEQPAPAPASQPEPAPLTQPASTPLTQPATTQAPQPATFPAAQPVTAFASQSATIPAGQPVTASPAPWDEVSHIMVDALPEEEPARTAAPDPGLIRAAAARTGSNPVVTARAGSVPTAQGTSPGSAPAREMPSPLRRGTAAALAEAAATLPRSTTGFSPTVSRGGNTQAMGRPSGNSRARTNGAPNRPAPAQRHAASPAGSSAKNARARRSPAETVELAARIKAERPTITEAELAAELGISPSRWRTVRREAAQTSDRELAA